MSETEMPMEDAIRALEHFVVDNEALLQLEERIGRFNIFDALGIVRTEIRHSNFLAWLLDPNESHGQGGLFLSAILMDLLRQSPAELRPFNPIQLDGAELRGVRVRREYKNIDILIECDDPPFLIAIENKVDSSEHSNQLARYKQTIHDHFPGMPCQYVFLTREGDEPSDEEWISYTYRDFHRVLSRVRNAGAANIGDDVITFLNHYLNLIGSRFMDDPQIEELCQMIYKNHRQAIDLIFEYGMTGRKHIVNTIENILKVNNSLCILSATSTQIRFIPAEWLNLLPPVAKKTHIGASNWLVLVIHVGLKSCTFRCVIRPTIDEQLNKAVADRLLRDSKEFGLKPIFKNPLNATFRINTLGSEKILTWKEGDDPDEEKLIQAVNKKLNKWLGQLAGVPEALRPLVREWEQQQGKA